MKALKIILFWFLSVTWGGIMTAIGALTFLVLAWFGYKPKRFHCLFYIEIGHGWGGLELGGFFLVEKDAGLEIKLHEAGHGVQNIIFGIFQPIISLASAIRYNYRKIVEKKNPEKYATFPDYDAIWFEKMASDFGHKYFK